MVERKKRINFQNGRKRSKNERGSQGDEKTKKGKSTKPKNPQEIDEKEAFKEEIVGYDIPEELSAELYSQAKDTINFQDDLKGKVYFFGNIAVLTFESFEETIARLVNSEAISIVTQRREYARFAKDQRNDPQAKVSK